MANKVTDSLEDMRSRKMAEFKKVIKANKSGEAAKILVEHFIDQMGRSFEAGRLSGVKGILEQMKKSDDGESLEIDGKFEI